MTDSTKLRLGHLSLLAAIALLIAYMVGGWRADPEPRWASISGITFWPVLLVSIAFYAWAKKGK